MNEYIISNSEGAMKRLDKELGMRWLLVLHTEME